MHKHFFLFLVIAQPLAAAEWPKTLYAVYESRCREFGGPPLFGSVTINTETLTYEKWLGGCLGGPSTTWSGTLEKSDRMLKLFSKECLHYSTGSVCTEFEPIHDGSFEIENTDTVIEYNKDGHEWNYYDIVESDRDLSPKTE